MGKAIVNVQLNKETGLVEIVFQEVIEITPEEAKELVNKLQEII